MNTPPVSRSGREIFEAIVLGKEWDFTDAEFESAVLDRQHTYPVLTQKGIDASGATVDVAVSNMLPINGSDFSGEIRNMLAALAQRIRETQPTMSQFASKADYERAVAAASENSAQQDAARWRFGVEHGFPSHHRQMHPEVKPLGWRMPSQNPPNGTTFFSENYPYYETAEQAIDTEMANAANR
jgi:hypothetical protein